MTDVEPGAMCPARIASVPREGPKREAVRMTVESPLSTSQLSLQL